jgi:hypothetical protein
LACKKLLANLIMENFDYKISPKNWLQIQYIGNKESYLINCC